MCSIVELHFIFIDSWMTKYFSVLKFENTYIETVGCYVYIWHLIIYFVTACALFFDGIRWNIRFSTLDLDVCILYKYTSPCYHYTTIVCRYATLANTACVD